MSSKPRFRTELLHPRYWLTWFGMAILWLWVQLPYPVLLKMGDFIGRASMRFLKRRVSIARQNLKLCFPHYTDEQVDAIVVQNFSSLGMGLIETGMAWFWPDARVRKWFEVRGLEHITAACDKGQGVMAIGVHFMSLELGGRVMGLCRPMMAMYRPHNNKAMEFIQTRGRSRSNKAMLDRRNLKGMVKALKAGEAVWFAPDQDYGPKGSSFAPFFAVQKAATTNGTYTIARLAKPAILTIVLIRKQDGTGYQLVIEPEFEDYPLDDEQAAAEYVNRKIEREIMRAPEQYLWLHRRFKTRPEGEPKLYTV
ncbi:kdo(2)-lipid IV(A) palmitoleoyltransferase [Buttiauxella sp. 3AFRM03]|jgi:KDO2-lipid IV(A) palmitoleoyltransferase|nr:MULTISPECIES: kdo(2)-lipid IV(A) palmitoleoyltransferase [Buttiauxella]AYN27406.1 kdo(2)-lipid IV(A) palmitoleoyltransferase [Buttiauxella sp. 3AFRM03]MCE0825265.1 kdo(2)-lipid IV(A) palmitoleoyltransferase [Buttiauxella ferragutiae]TDN51631.1 KDO2-lipid IV(A) palmitoleoyltransferase [Buttiauxella sp. JUb87]UNK60503.1 kdo(2)-lipid IV(A) palmitoleoyltransferase [Buttiauxella ferragutiae]